MARPLRAPFKEIGNGILVSCVSGDGGDTDEGPNVVLLFGWMGAKVTHIFKYTKVYEERYPGATIFIIPSSPVFFWSSEKSNQSRLLPLVSRLRDMGCISYPDNSIISNHSSHSTTVEPLTQPRILVHSFSNGGASQLATMSRLLKRLGAASPQNLTAAFVIDSSPGSGGLSTTLRAFAGQIKNPFLRFLMKSLTTLMYFTLFIRTYLFRETPLFERLRTDLLNPNLLPWTTKDTPRLYVFSRTDELVPGDQVEAHARKSQEVGLNTQIEIFELSPHVAHARTDAGRYWGAVRRTWEIASAVNPG